ncbi:MAG TPA: hypothetical protein VFS22_11065 [Flavisolibacter sp.]|nr:hypothetical protein [Flavisolibacter sp.]
MNRENHGCAELLAYEPLLRKIASCFGLAIQETERLLKEVYASANFHGAGPDTSASIKMHLSKMMVRKCIFQLSTELFSRSGFYRGHATRPSLTCALGYEDTNTFHFHDMPLSFRAVYILKTNAGFAESEIAEVLNASSIQVRERLAKARLFINTYLR